MKKNILLLLILVLAIGSVYFFGMKKNNILTSTQTADQTANWKTYVNQKYGYTFKYPKDWLPDTKYNRDGFFRNNDWSQYFEVYVVSEHNTYDEWVNGRKTTQIIEPSEVIIDKTVGLRITSKGIGQIDGNNFYIIDTVIKKDNFVFDLGGNLNSHVQKQMDDFTVLYDQILSTFKFITPVATDTSSSTTAAAPNAVIYEKYFFPNNAKSYYEGYDYIKFDDQKKVLVFNNGNIYFEYEPNKYILSYQILNNPPEGPKEKQTQTINLEDINKKYKLGIKLHMYGIGGGCPDFPKGYEVVSTILDNKNIFKAKFIDEKTANLNWPPGNIYLVDKGQYGWNCPNIAGLSSVKNGSVDIQYDLRFFGRDYNSQDYISAEKSLDKIVSTIRNFWK